MGSLEVSAEQEVEVGGSRPTGGVSIELGADKNEGTERVEEPKSQDGTKGASLDCASLGEGDVELTSIDVADDSLATGGNGRVKDAEHAVEGRALAADSAAAPISEPQAQNDSAAAPTSELQGQKEEQTFAQDPMDLVPCSDEKNGPPPERKPEETAKLESAQMELGRASRPGDGKPGGEAQGDSTQPREGGDKLETMEAKGEDMDVDGATLGGTGTGGTGTGGVGTGTTDQTEDVGLKLESHEDMAVETVETEARNEEMSAEAGGQVEPGGAPAALKMESKTEEKEREAAEEMLLQPPATLLKKEEADTPRAAGSQDGEDAGAAESPVGDQEDAKFEPIGHKEGEDLVCFICYDGGELCVCERGKCTKCYHLDCINMKEEEFDDLKKHRVKWYCDWHFCSNCKGKDDRHSTPAKWQCLTCPVAFCKKCYEPGLLWRGKGVPPGKGFCLTCRDIMAMLELGRDTLPDGSKVDFDDQTCFEAFYKDYWDFLKPKMNLHFDKDELQRMLYDEEDAGGGAAPPAKPKEKGRAAPK